MQNIFHFFDQNLSIGWYILCYYKDGFGVVGVARTWQIARDVPMGAGKTGYKQLKDR